MVFNSFEELLHTPSEVTELLAKSSLLRKYYKIDAELIKPRAEATHLNCSIVANIISDVDLMKFYSECRELIPKNKTVRAIELHYYLVSRLTSALYLEEWGQDLDDSIFEAIKTSNLKVLNTYLPVSDKAQMLFTSMDTSLSAVNEWLASFLTPNAPIVKYTKVEQLLIERTLELVSTQLSSEIGKPVKIVLA